ncbi:MAG: redox-sensing transcriptional repressor Rex [Chitinispirillaceae bacterium]|nr:redox-sensing transcriptional repressor Rex [Chitinispirillaceae bacterium]
MKKITKAMEKEIPQPTIIRLCSLFQLLGSMDEKAVVSSAGLEETTGIPSHTIRKDISYVGEVGSTGSGYEVGRLRAMLSKYLGFGVERRACVVGLGQIGGALIAAPVLSGGEFRIVAGFDSSINKLETMKTAIPVFPSHQICEIVKSMGIELGIIAVPPAAAQETCDRLVAGGILGIVNYAPVILRTKSESCFIRNMDITGELRILSAMISIKKS